jgi:hypothetical protein
MPARQRRARSNRTPPESAAVAPAVVDGWTTVGVAVKAPAGRVR